MPTTNQPGSAPDPYDNSASARPVRTTRNSNTTPSGESVYVAGAQGLNGLVDLPPGTFEGAQVYVQLDQQINTSRYVDDNRSITNFPAGANGAMQYRLGEDFGGTTDVRVNFITGRVTDVVSGNVSANTIVAQTYQGNISDFTNDSEYVSLNALSVTTRAASGNGALSYNNLTGVFTFTPADTSYGNSNVAAYLPTYTGTVGAGTVTATGNISAARFLGDGSQLTGMYGNANVSQYLPTYTGDIGADNVTATGNISADYILGNGSQLTGMYGDADVEALLPAYAGNVGAGNVNVTGNVTAAYVLGDGSQLTGMYGDANVEALLPTYTGVVAASELEVSDGAGNAWLITGNSLSAPSGAEWRSESDSLDDFITSAANGYINLQSLYVDGNIASEIHLEHGVAQIRVADGPFVEWAFRNNGQLDVPGSIMPQANNSASLGNATRQWSELWVSDNTIYIGGVPLGIGAGNILTVAGQPVLSNDSTSSVTTTGNITADYFFGNGSQLTGMYSNVDVASYLPTYSGNVSAGNISVSGNVQAAYILGDGSQLTGMPAPYANANVAAYLPTYQGNIRAANIAAGNITVTGTVQAQSYLGDGSTLSGMYSNVNAAAYLPTYTGNVGAGNVNVTGNVRATYVLGDGSQLTGMPAPYANANVSAYLPVYAGNISAGNISVSGNIRAAYILGDGSQLTGLPPAYANANVASYLPTYQGNIGAGNVNITGNVQADYVLGNGSQLTGLPQQYSNANVAAYLPTYSGNIGANTVTAAGNVQAAYFLGDGSQLTGLPEQYSNANVAAYLVSYSGNIAAGNVTATGNATADYFLGNGSQLTGMYGNAEVAAYLPTYSGNIGGTNISVEGLDVTGDAVITGNLRVTGNTTFVNSQSLVIGDLNVILANLAQQPSDANGAGVIVGNVTGDTYGTMLWDSFSNTWVITDNVQSNTATFATVTASGNITAARFLGNGSQLTGMYGNAQVASYLPTYGGNISAGNAAIAGNITAAYVLGNGSQLTGLPAQYSNANVSAYLPTYSGNIGANNVTASGNVTAAYVIGDGSLLTNLPLGGYSNANVAAYLPTYQGNISAGNISVSGNIEAAFVLGNGSQLTGLPAQYSNVNVAAYLPTYIGNIGAGNVTVSGNVSADYVLGNGSQLTGLPQSYANANVAAYLPTYIGNISAGNISVSGLTTLSNAEITGTVNSSIIPTSNGVYSLGNSTNWWSNLWVTSNTIYIGGVPMGVSNDVLTVNGQTVLSNGSNTNIATAGTISAGNLISDGTVQAASVLASGNITASGRLDATGNISAGNIVTAGIVQATGNVSGGNITTAGTVTATGNISGGNITTAGQFLSTGNVSGGNITTAGVVQATGNVSGGNITTTGAAAITGNVSAGNISTTGLITATGNVTAGNLVTAGQITATGNVTAGNVSTAGQVNVTGNTTVSGNLSAGNISTAGIAAVSGNLSAGNISTAGAIAATGNARVGNLVVTSGNGNIALTTTANSNIVVSRGTTTALSITGNSIAIGNNAANGQIGNSIVLNAAGSSISTPTAGLYIDPIRIDNSGNLSNSYYIAYNTSTRELTYADASPIGQYVDWGTYTPGNQTTANSLITLTRVGGTMPVVNNGVLLRAGVTYQLEAQIYWFLNGSGASSAWYFWSTTSNTGTQVPGTTQGFSAPSAGGSFGSSGMMASGIITPTVDTYVYLWLSNAALISADNVGFSHVIIRQLGFSNWTQQTLNVSGNVTSGNVVTGNVTTTGNITSGGNITSSGNLVLPAGGLYTRLETINGNIDNTQTPKLRMVTDDGRAYIQVGNGISGTTGNIVFSPWTSGTERVRIDTGGGNVVVSGSFNTANGVFNKSSGYVNAGSFVTLDNIQATITTTGNRGLAIRAVSGSFTYNMFANFSQDSSSGGASASSQTATTTLSSSLFTYSFGSIGAGGTFIINDTTNNRTYRIIFMIGPAYNNNFISIERL